MQSELVQLRQRIEEECQALQNLSLFSSVASHETIKQKYNQLDRYHSELKRHVGDEQATSTIVEIYNGIVR